MRRRDCRLAILLGVAIVATATPAAAQLAPDRHGAIHACYGPYDRDELHLSGADEPCRHGEARLTWNQRGRPGAGAGIGDLSLVLDLTSHGSSNDNDDNKSTSSWRKWISEASSTLGDGLLLLGLGAFALSIALVPVGKLAGWPKRWPVLWRFRLFRWFGPGLQILPFEDGAMESKLGPSLAVQTQTRVGGGQEGGRHLYLVTGEQPAGLAVADLQAVPQTKALAAALSLLQLTWRRRRLIVSGALTPVDGSEAAAVTLSLRSNSKWVNDAELWPSEPPTKRMTATTSNRVLAVAAAGWIEHVVVDQTPGPRSYEQFLSYEPQSWALFRAGAELSRISCLKEAADHYERALAIDPDNIGALVDLAHLRRMDGYFEGAEALAIHAIDLIEARSERHRGARREDDANWYRAQIVLTTIDAEWAKDLEHMSEEAQAEGEQAEADREQAVADVRREETYERALLVATAAMDARDRLERIVGEEELKRATRGPRIRLVFRWRARGRALLERRKLDPDRAVELYVLLATTFEPGALLLVAANCPRHAKSPPGGKTSSAARGTDEERRKSAIAELAKARRSARRELERGDELDPGPPIEYIRALRLISPRVLYNLACLYSIAARTAGGKEKQEYLGISFESLRQCISRSPPLERRALLGHVNKDPDLDALRNARDIDIEALWKLVPEPEAQR